jgi:uncharacterized protein YgbK (DUF1537 family)
VNKALVIADDLSGAAEIAGIAVRFGLSVALQSFSIARNEFDADLLVIDTDSRSLSGADAAIEINSVGLFNLPGEYSLVYKKIDSVLRGPIGAEVEELMEWVGARSALVVPQSPSRGRTIIDGKYLIDGVPLDRTAFANDPQWPAMTSEVVRLVRGGQMKIRYAESPANRRSDGIVIGGGATREQIQAWAKSVDASTLPVGSGDFFEAMLTARGLGNAPVENPAFSLAGAGLYVSGTTAQTPASALVGHTTAMPNEIFDSICSGKTPGEAEMANWRREIVEGLDRKQSVLVAIGRPVKNRAVAPELALRLAEVVALVLTERSVDWIVLEGGATASAVLRRWGWNDLRVVDELSPGIVSFRGADGRGPDLIIKPGSYSWPSFEK